MIRVHVSPEDLAEIRFAFSPTWELVMSAMKALKNPAKHALHMPWVQEARTAIEGRDLGILFAITSGSQYVPDFATPPPTTPFPELDEELELVGADEIAWRGAVYTAVETSETEPTPSNE